MFGGWNGQDETAGGVG